MEPMSRGGENNDSKNGPVEGTLCLHLNQVNMLVSGVVLMTAVSPT